MRRLTGFDQLEPSFFDWPAGTWWMIPDRYTKISPRKRESHRWLLFLGLNSRTALAHACLRTTQEPMAGDSALVHDPHDATHESTCRIDERGYVKPATVRALKIAWLKYGPRSCLEPSPEFVDAVVAGAVERWHR